MTIKRITRYCVSVLKTNMTKENASLDFKLKKNQMKQEIIS